MGKLHELLAVEGDLQGAANRIVRETEHVFGSTGLDGVTKTHEVIVEGEDDYPPESRELVTTVPERLAYTLESLTKVIDAAVSKEKTNTVAAANVMIDGETLLEEVPATALLNLENRFGELRKLIEKIPTLDNMVKWEKDETRSHVVKSPEQIKYRTRKVEDFRIVVPASEHHPADVREVTTDKRVGVWKTVVFSGKVTSKVKSRWLANCDKVLRALKKAR